MNKQTKVLKRVYRAVLEVWDAGIDVGMVTKRMHATFKATSLTLNDTHTQREREYTSVREAER